MNLDLSSFPSDGGFPPDLQKFVDKHPVAHGTPHPMKITTASLEEPAVKLDLDSFPGEEKATPKTTSYEAHPLKGGQTPKLSHEVPSYSLDALKELSKPITQDDKITGVAQRKEQYQKDFQEAKGLATGMSLSKLKSARASVANQLKDPNISPEQRRSLQIKAAAMSDYVQSLDTNIVDALGMALPLAPVNLEKMVVSLFGMAKGSLAHFGEVLGRSAKARQKAVNDLIDHGHDPEHAKTAIDTLIKEKSKPAMGPVERTMPTEKEGITPAKAEHVWQATARQHQKAIDEAFPPEIPAAQKQAEEAKAWEEAKGTPAVSKEEAFKRAEAEETSRRILDNVRRNLFEEEAAGRITEPTQASRRIGGVGQKGFGQGGAVSLDLFNFGPKAPAIEHIEAAAAPKEVEPIHAPEHHTVLKTGEPVVYFHQSTPSGHIVYAENPDTGEQLGKVEFAPHRTQKGKWEGLVKVEEQHRRKGIASGMYQHAEERMGIPIAPSIHQTDAGKAFTAGRPKGATNSQTPPTIFPRQSGMADPALLLHITGAAAGAALDPENPLEGAALGLSVTGLAHFGVGRFARVASGKNLDLSALVERYKPDLTTIKNTKQLSDAFFWSKASNHADSAVIAQHIETATKEGVTKEIDQMFRDASEGSITLNAKGQALYNRTVQPLRDIVNSIRAKYGAAADIAIKDLGTRIALNHRTWLDAMLEGGEMQSRGGAQRIFSGKPGASKARTVFATNDGHIVTTKKIKGAPGYTVTMWKDGEVVGTRMSKTKPTEGMEFGEMRLKQAKQKDIEQHSPVRYVQSDLAVWGLRAKEMLRYNRDQELLHGIVSSKDPDGMSLFPHESEGVHNIPPDYRKLTGDAAAIPQLQGRYMPANLAEVIEDEAKANKAGLGNFINSAVVKSMMVNFIPHAMNEFVHWWDARGLSGVLTPKGIPMGASKGWSGLAKTFPDAVKSVITMDKFQTDLMRHGGALMAPSRREAANMDRILQYGMQEAMKSGSMSQIAQAAGMSPFRLMKKISDGSSAVMWGIRDIFYTQLVKEQMLMGKEMREAVLEVDRHMPPYRIPSRVLGSRHISQLMQNPLVVFSAYHHNMLSSLGEMAKEIASPAIKGHSNEFVKGLDRAMALTAAMAVVFPLADATLTSAFGKQGEKITQRRAGPMHPIEAVGKFADDPTYQNLAAFGMGILTPSPVLTMAPEVMFNRSVWSGKPIMKPGTEGKDLARYVASKLHPADVAAKVAEGKQSTEAALLNVLDVITKTRKQQDYERAMKALHRAQRAAARR